MSIGSGSKDLLSVWFSQTLLALGNHNTVKLMLIGGDKLSYKI